MEEAIVHEKNFRESITMLVNPYEFEVEEEAYGSDPEDLKKGGAQGSVKTAMTAANTGGPRTAQLSEDRPKLIKPSYYSTG